jgi:hypothetical protein
MNQASVLKINLQKAGKIIVVEPQKPYKKWRSGTIKRSTLVLSHHSKYVRLL